MARKVVEKDFFFPKLFSSLDSRCRKGTHQGNPSRDGPSCHTPDSACSSSCGLREEEREHGQGRAYIPATQGLQGRPGPTSHIQVGPLHAVALPDSPCIHNIMYVGPGDSQHSEW